MIKDMPVVILAGGKGINLGEKCDIIPKPMVSVNGKPLLGHIIGHYMKYGFKKFIIAGGYGQKMISDYIRAIPGGADIRLVDTGIDSMTGSRLAQLRKMIEPAGIFCLTYGDTISDVDLAEELGFHLKHKKTATLLAAHNPTRFRILGLIEDEDVVKGMAEKPILEKDYINGGYYIMNASIFTNKKLSSEPSCVLEEQVLEDLVSKKELYAFRHNGVWQPLDNERDRQKIVQMINGGLE